MFYTWMNKIYGNGSYMCWGGHIGLWATCIMRLQQNNQTLSSWSCCYRVLQQRLPFPSGQWLTVLFQTFPTWELPDSKDQINQLCLFVCLLTFKQTVHSVCTTRREIVWQLNKDVNLIIGELHGNIFIIIAMFTNKSTVTRLYLTLITVELLSILVLCILSMCNHHPDSKPCF